MLHCYLQHNILSKGGKKNKEVKNASMPWWPSQHQSARSPSSPGLLNALLVCLLCTASEDFYSPAVFALLWCKVPNWIPHSLQTGSQPAAASRLELRESGCGLNSTMWEQPSTNWWNTGLERQRRCTRRTDVRFEPSGSLHEAGLKQSGAEVHRVHLFVAI